MVNLELVKYIRQLITNGYDVPSIKSHLVQSGYSGGDIDSAIDYIYHPPPAGSVAIQKKKIIISGLIGSAGFVIIAILLYSFVFAGPKMLIDLNLQSLGFEVDSGDYFEFIRDLTNIGSASRFDVLMSYTIIDPRSKAIVNSQDESFAIQTKSSKKIIIPVPSDTKPGRYTLKAVASYGKQTAEASTSFKVVEKVEVSCNDRIKNQGERGVDCGGPCSACPTSLNPNKEQPLGCPAGCDDFDPCTTDLCDGSKCSYQPLEVCCGDFVCSGGETTITCASDCAASRTPIRTSGDIIDEALSDARSDPQNARNLCSSLSKLDDSDSCYSLLADETEDFNFCDDVSADDKRDTCYMDFALAKNQFEVCGKLANRYLKNSCFSLKNLRLLQLQAAAFSQ